jgi:hypothetical protein
VSQLLESYQLSLGFSDVCLSKVCVFRASIGTCMSAPRVCTAAWD